jgi:hypothetical protein
MMLKRIVPVTVTVRGDCAPLRKTRDMLRAKGAKNTYLKRSCIVARAAYK